MDNKQLWDTVLLEAELSLSKANFTTWFKNTRITKIDGGVVYVGVQNEFIREWLMSKHSKFVLRILRESSEMVRSVEYIITTTEEVSGTEKKEWEAEKRFIGMELPLGDLYINKEDNLNPRYTFENLVVGPFNEVANAAAEAVAKRPGFIYNPLFIYGGTGLGKTHIVQAVGNFIKKGSERRRVYYVASEKFTVEFVNALKANRMNEFKEKYRKYDVFIMDDIQFLVGKDKTQEELFHLFNTLYETNKQIIFSSDKHPNHILGLEERLKSRFGAGMIVDVSMPEYESRVAIVKHKAKANNFLLGDDMVSFLAASLECSVREMEGILNSIICQCRMKGRELTVNEVKQVIKNSVVPKKTASVKDIIRIVSEFYQIEEGMLYEKTRRKEVVKPRQIAMYLLREDYNISFPTIGERFGGRDHTTVIHSCEKVKSDLKSIPGLSEDLSQIRSML
ncbi:chromosomal replication initiator protein DnaA [bacterium]|nr:chromosomal replication initiator protein DnaA [bacterium]